MPFKLVVVAKNDGALGDMVRHCSIDQFENEGKMVSYGIPKSATVTRK